MRTSFSSSPSPRRCEAWKMKKYWLIIISLIILAIGVLYFTLNESRNKLFENKEPAGKNLNSIPLEKPPF